MNNIKLFEGQEVRVKTSEGKTLINLVHVAKCCGVTNIGNTGKPKIRWSNIKSKLDLIFNGDRSLSPKIQEEINYILEDIMRFLLI